jgi:hypothetical protein
LGRLSKPLPGAQVNWCHPSSSGLASWWLFNEGSGPRVEDIAGPYFGTLQGAAWEVGREGTAIVFDGTNDYIQLGVDIYETHTVGTIIASIEMNALPSVNAIFSNSGSGANGLVLYVDSTGKLRIREFISGVGSADYQGGTVMSTLTEYQVAVRTSGTAWSLFVNGKLETLTVITSPNAGRWFSRITGTTQVRIGTVNMFGVTGWFNGIIYGIRLYNRGLSNSEIAGIYTNRYGNILDFGMKRISYFVPSVAQASFLPLARRSQRALLVR